MDIYKMKPAKYSMTFKHPPLGDRTQKPGPGSHCPEKVRFILAGTGSSRKSVSNFVSERTFRSAPGHIMIFKNSKREVLHNTGLKFP